MPADDARHPAPRKRLTDAALKALRGGPRARDVRDGDSGLIARVLPSGRVQWTVRYRFHGRQRRVKLGSYSAVGLARARRLARDAQAVLDRGQDPGAVRRAARSRPKDTVAALAADYLKRHAVPHKRSAHEDERRLAAHVIPAWGDRPAREITRRDVRALLDSIIDRPAPIEANRTLALVRKMFNYAIDADWCENNPAARIPRPSKEVSRERVLADDEIRRLVRCLTNRPRTADKPAPRRRRQRGPDDDPLCPIAPALADVQLIRLWTAQRGGETLRMRWSDVDLVAGWWTIPAEHAKNGRQHRVPLTAPVVRLLAKRYQTAPAAAVSVFTGRGGSTLIERAKRASRALADALDIQDFKLHDLRRSAATRMAEAGVPVAHVSHVLNHVAGGARATRIYDRHSYDAEKRLALETWARTLAAILEDRSLVNNVVSFTRGGSQ